MTDKDKRIQDLSREVDVLREENTLLRHKIGEYVCENHLCRFCAYLHADCSPNDDSCVPIWRGI